MTPLTTRIRARADVDGLPVDHELRTLSEAFEIANAGYWGDPQTVPVKNYMGAYARLKLTWHKYSGEPLV